MTALLTSTPAKSRLLVPLGLVAITAASWAYLWLLTNRMGDSGSPLAMPMTSRWSGPDVVLMWTMWAVMMAGMMLPSATPMIATYATTIRLGRSTLGGLLLAGAGVYQFTGIKDACLSKCRTPLGFLLSNWRAGRTGALVMGAYHGSLCVGCCWMLMALLFVLGVMNLWWIAVVAAVVLVERLVPSRTITRGLGAGLMTWGAALLVGIA